MKTVKTAKKLAEEIGWVGVVCANGFRDAVDQERALDILAEKYGFELVKEHYTIGINEGNKYEQ